MDMFYIPALASFSGSASGTLASIVTGWVTQRRKDRVRHGLRATSQREELYKEFIGEASRLYADALVNDKSEVSKLVDLYALIARMKILSSDAVIEAADEGGSVDSRNLSFAEQDIRRSARAHQRDGSVARFQRGLPPRIAIARPTLRALQPCRCYSARRRVADFAEGPHFPQSASQAARKKLTRSRTKAGNSLRRSFAPSPIRARIIIGSRMRSMKICVVARLRLPPKGPLEPRESACVASFRIWDTAAAARSRPCLVDVAAQRRESVGFGNRHAGDADRFLDKSFHDLAAEARELVLHCAAPRHKTFEIRQTRDDAGHNRFEQCFLSLEMGIDRRLARRRHLSNLVETCALIASLEEDALGRIEDSRFHVTGQALGRSSQPRPLRIIVLAHHRLHPCVHDAASA